MFARPAGAPLSAAAVRRAAAVLIALVAASFAVVMGATASPALATTGWTGTGQPCQSSAYDCVDGGYQATAATTGNSWAWNDYGEVGADGIQTTAGPHNCTLYVAWRLQTSGMSPQPAWGQASQWGQHFRADQNAVPGSVAWWNTGPSGHVAYVEQVSGSRVRVSADNFLGDGSYREHGQTDSGAAGYTDSGWIWKTAPTGYLHPYPAGEAALSAPARPSKPAQPGKPLASRSGTSKTINVSWPAVAGATKYRLQWSNNGGRSWHRGTVSGTSKAFRGSYGRTYLFQVQAGNKLGWSAYSPYADPVTLNRIPPGQPGQPSASLSGNTITLTWPAVPGATRYHYQWSNDGGASWHSGRTGPGTSVTFRGAYTITYIFQVQAASADGGWGAYSAYSDPVTVSGAPPQPGQPSASPSGTSVNLTWPAVAGATKYRYQWSNDGGSSWHITGTSSSTSATFGGRQGRTYIFQVQAGNDAGWGAFSAYSEPVTV
jgi:surface antigen